MKERISTHSSIDEETLVTRLAQRDISAVEILYDRYAPALYGVIYRIVGSEEVAEDILQEAFVKIWNSFPSYDRSKGKLFTWMVRVVRNLAIDTIKSKDFRNARKNQDLDSIVHLVDQQTHVSYNPDQIGLKEIVDQLQPEYQEIIDLVYFQGLTQAEACEQLKIPLGTLKTRLRAAVSKLRTIFS